MQPHETAEPEADAIGGTIVAIKDFFPHMLDYFRMPIYFIPMHAGLFWPCRQERICYAGRFRKRVGSESLASQIVNNADPGRYSRGSAGREVMNMNEQMLILVIPMTVAVIVKIILMAGRFCSLNDVNSREDARRLRCINEYKNWQSLAKKRAG